MGLHESTGKEEFTTEVYVTNAGTKVWWQIWNIIVK